MKIWIMRHGEAGFNAQNDSERNLTENGKKMAYRQGEWLGNRLANLNARLDKIIVSPYVRTQQTFAELAKGLQAVGFSQNLTNQIEIWAGITPDGSPEQVYDYLNFLRDEGAENILLISHLPLVFDLVHCITHYQQSVHFYPAVLAEIDWKGNYGTVQAVQNP